VPDVEYNAEVHDELAPRVYDLLQANSRLTINLIASQLDAQLDDVAYVIRSYEVVDGVPQHNGMDQGGGWVPEEQQLEGYTPENPEFVGYRWPDGELHDEPYES
jgi:hypothetical protein